MNKRDVRRREWADRRERFGIWLEEARCFLTWPFGHAYAWPDDGVKKCVGCGRHYPYNL